MEPESGRPATYKPGDPVPATGIYWCSVCKTPAEFTRGQTFPACRNLCGRCRWELVRGESDMK